LELTASPPDGVLVIDKPSGPTSHDVVARVRRVIGIRRIGHTGTLDPLATGVLPLVIGRATRLAALLSSGEKSYEAAVRLGAATESYDASERLAAGVRPPEDPGIDTAVIGAALDRFRGTYLQVPPAYSAKKIGGVAAHRLARRHKPAQPAPVSVTVSDLRLLSVESGLVRLAMTASAGFYVRTLAHELGQALGCGAHLEALRRTRAGDFGIEDAAPLQDVESDPDVAASRLIPLERLLTGLPGVTLSERGTRRAGHGNDIEPVDFAAIEPAGATTVQEADHVRLFDPTGRFLAVARPAARGVLRPAIVLV
jgi:tRNA pseudouridine55 synthase